MKDFGKHALLVLAGLATILGGTGCRGLVGIRGTVVSEATVLERQVMGERAEIGAGEVLLDPIADPENGLSEDELREMDERWSYQEERLARVERPGLAVRFWQAVILHNRAAVAARLGQREAALDLLGRAAQHCHAYRLDTLRWQALSALGRLQRGEKGYAALQRAEKILFEAHLLTQREYEVESSRGRRLLYGNLIGNTLAKKDKEAAFRMALRQRTVELARVSGPEDMTFAEGELAPLIANLRRARTRMAEARKNLFSLSVDEALRDGAARSVRSARDALATARGRIEEAEAGGLVVPARPDVYALQENLWTDTAFLLISRLDAERFAAFYLSRDGLKVSRGEIPSARLKAALAGNENALDVISRTFFRPFSESLGGPVKRVYLAIPSDLLDVSWSDVPFGSGEFGDVVQLSFVGGGEDVNASLRQRSYGRDSLLVVRAPGEGDREVASLLAARSGGRSLRADQIEPDQLRYADSLWFGTPLELSAFQPGRSFIRTSPEFGRVRGLGPGSLLDYQLRAGCAAFSRVRADGEGAGEWSARRLIQRAMVAAGVPTCLFVDEAAGGERRAQFWRTFYDQLSVGPAGEAFRKARKELPPGERRHFRLHGFLGMNETEYAQYSRMEFNERFKRANRWLEEKEYKQAAAEFLNVWQMASALEFQSDRQKLIILSNLQRYVIQSWKGLGRYDRAAHHQRLLIQYLKKRQDYPERAIGLEYQSLGALLTRADRFDPAVQAYETSLELLEQHGDSEQVALVLGELGKSYDQGAKYDAALQSFDRALRRYRELEKAADAARQLRRMGALMLRRRNRAHRAREYFERALKLFTEQDDQEGIVRTTIDIGLCLRHIGDFPAALERFRQAEEKCESRIESAGKDLRVYRELLARALAEVANTRWFEGKYQDAFRLIQRSNDLARRADDHFQLNVNQQLLGLIHWELNQYEKAHEALDVAMGHARRAQDRLEISSVHNNRGIVYRRQDRYESALTEFGKALSIDRQLNSRWGQGYDHRNIGITLQRMGKLDEAQNHLQRAVELSAEIEDAVNLARALYYLGDLRREMGSLDRAEQLLQRALKQSRSVYLPEVEWRALRGLGLLHQSRGQTATALENFKAAVDVVEQLRGQLKVQSFRSGFLANKMDVYEETVGLLLEAGRPEEAFRYAERSRARHFIDILATQDFQLRSERERELYEQQSDLSRRMRSLQESLRRETEESARQELAEELAGVREQYRDVLTRIQAENPELASLVTVQVAGPNEIANSLGEDVSLVTYYLMPEKMAMWVIRDGQLNVRVVDADREEFTAGVRDYRIAVQRQDLLEDVRDAAGKLYQDVFAPVEELIAGSRAVGVVPHRALHYLSFATLHDGKDFLVSRLPMFYLPSASLMPMVIGKPVPRRPHWETLKVLAVGNPQANDPALRLPFTVQEVDSLRRTFVQETDLTGERATEKWVKANIGKFDVVHFAAHGYFNPVNPLFSALVLAPDEENEDDGILELHEVSGLKVNAHLVGLSACQSGVGKIENGDELVSLSRAFLYAGTNSILSTLWRVDDVSTALLMKHFYRRYAGRVRDEGLEGDETVSKAASLREAQLQVMRDGRHYHPVYWGAITLTGDYR